VRRFAFYTPAGKFRAAYTVRGDKRRVIVAYVGPGRTFIRSFRSI